MACCASEVLGKFRSERPQLPARGRCAAAESDEEVDGRHSYAPRTVAAAAGTRGDDGTPGRPGQQHPRDLEVGERGVDGKALRLILPAADCAPALNVLES